jgi:hypothetical protein
MSKKAAVKATKAVKKAPKKETTRKRKEKKVKDPNAPKRACSAYIFYSQHRREHLIKEKPSLNHKEVISELSKEWNGLSEADKAPYVKQADADKARYKKESESYNKKK